MSGNQQTAPSWPRWWRLTVIGMAMLILCSCRGVPRDGRKIPADNNGCPPTAAPAAADRGSAVTLPATAWTGAPEARMLPADTAPAPWSPPGIARPWPRDEYILDGGDRGLRSRVRRDWNLHGVDMEDTIAHFDTLDGRTIIEPSNRVHIYAPRFGAVRKTVGVGSYDVKQALVQYDVPTRVGVNEKTLVPGSTMQQLQVQSRINARRARAQQLNDPGLTVGSATGLLETINREKLLEGLRVLQDGVIDQADEPVLALRVQDAIVWTHDKGVQVVLDGRAAKVDTGDARPQATMVYDRQGTPRLRIVKTASTDAATPGTVIDFALRFDNIGTQPIGNVTIVDNLTTRLEYVDDSQSCSVEADFFTQANEGGSLVLRWEVIDPLEVGQGGTIRFKCRVR